MDYTVRMTRVFSIALTLAALTFGALAFGAAAQSVSFPSVATGNVAAGPQIKAWLARPAGEGPFPAIIVLHNCAGVGAHTYDWARRIGGWGYVTLVPDSSGSRGEGGVATPPVSAPSQVPFFPRRKHARDLSCRSGAEAAKWWAK
jgi:dienelactone hydrolase